MQNQARNGEGTLVPREINELSSSSHACPRFPSQNASMELQSIEEVNTMAKKKATKKVAAKKGKKESEKKNK